KKEAEEKAKKEAAEKAKKEAEEKAKKEAAEKAKKEAEEKAKKEAAEKAKKEAEEKAKKEAAEKAKKEAEEKAKKEAAEKAKKEAEEKAKKEAAEKAKKEAEEKAKKEAAEKAKKEAEEKAKKEAAEKAKKEAEEKAKKEAAEKAKKEAEEKAKQEAADKAKKLAEEEAKRKTNGEAAKQSNGSAPTTPTQEKPATSKQDAKSNKKNNKRTPKNSVSEDEKNTTKVTGSKNVQSGDFASSAEPVTVAKSQESQSAPVPIPKTPEAAPGSPKASPKPANAKQAAPVNGKQQTPPAKTPEKSPPQPKTAARASPPKTTAKAPSPPKTTPAAARAPPKPSTPPASKKPEPPPKPEFLKKKSPSVEKEKVVAAKVAPTATAPQQVPQQAPAAAPSPSSVPAPSTPAPVPTPATVPTTPAEPTGPAAAEGAVASARLTEEALNGAKKPATAGAGAASKPKPVQKKPEVPPKPDVHSKSAAKMKTPIKQPGGKTSTVTMTSEPVQNKHLTTIQSDSRSPAAELSRTEAFKKNMDIISTIADVLLSHSRSKKIRGTGPSTNDSSKPTTNSSTNSPSSSTSTSLESSSPSSSASLLSSLFPSLSQSSGPAASTSHQASSPSSDAPKQKSKLDLERILRILQASQPPSRSGGTDSGQGASSSSTSGSDPSASSSLPFPEMPSGMDADDHPLGSFLTKDAIRMLMPTLQEVNVKFNVEKQLQALNATAAMAKILPKTLPPGTDTTEEDELEEDLLDEESEDTIEYKFTPRPVFIATICQVCKNPLKSFFHCERCRMVSYCGDEHRRSDQPSHRELCTVLCEIAANRGGHIYQLAKKLNVQEYRNLRVHTLNQIELSLKRSMQAFEREIVLFPRICLAPDCREWRQELLTECTDCRQVSYCIANPTHLQASHRRWCKAYLLFQKLILRQRILGRIEPVLPTRILTKSTPLPANIDEAFKQLYKNSSVPRDECVYAVLSQIATAPLSALYAFQQTGLSFGNTFTIHLVGAELQFEGDTLDKWEAFFLHLVPEVAVLRVVFVGPELNVENLPIDVISRFRMCRTCRLKCRVVAFDFQCRTMYHDYRHSSRYQRPNLICFFNPGLHRTTGFAGLDSWPATICAATEAGCPMLVTAYTELESPLDLERLQRESTRTLQIVQSPTVNPFASKRPDRNFISDDTAPMIFKNYYYFVVK
uniref:MYND-type domain-containing protein n=1 Tax=Anopheles culicifacies TaxID=139723 RepID=A0A182M9V1_9DIPT